MIDKYYNGVIEQVYKRIGKSDRNIVMVSYSNDFSVGDLESIKRYSSEDSVFFVCHEYNYEDFVSAYEPFLDTICDIYRKYIGGDFEEFLEECGVYYLHRPILKSYYETGVCQRVENTLLNEVDYEKEQMTKSIVRMLGKVSEVKPVFMVINRFHLSGRSTMELVKTLLKIRFINIGIVLGVNEVSFHNEAMHSVWNEIIERIQLNSQKYHIGSTGKRRAEVTKKTLEKDFSKELVKAMNSIMLLDLDLAKEYFEDLDHKIKFDNWTLTDEHMLELYFTYAKNMILLGEMSKAIELVGDIKRIKVKSDKDVIEYKCNYLLATCYMYQGKLNRAEKYADLAIECAERFGSADEVFKGELLKVQAKMSGWYNIFFCVQDIAIDESLIEKLMAYNYTNHLAHIYIYAYDNKPESVAKAYRSEDALFYFSKGISLAKEIGNVQLVTDAYQKNIMIASTNGMNEIAMLYSVRTYQFLQNKSTVSVGRLFSGIGYNLSALGHTNEAYKYYNRAISIFYKLSCTTDIAEVFYNRALNYILEEQYANAENDLLMCMKIIEKMHLNSLRVCNLSKLYALLALTCVLQKDYFGCERHLLSCRQFLNYVTAKEKENKNREVIHDYALFDDDMFVYTFARAILNSMDGKMEDAFVDYEQAEKFFAKAEGNQIFTHHLFRQKRMEIFDIMGRKQLYEREKNSLKQHDEYFAKLRDTVNMSILDEMNMDDWEEKVVITDEDIENLVKQESLLGDYHSIKRQMDFISVWQKIIDVNDVSVDDMVANAITNFLNHFSTDRALYIWYRDDSPKVIYNDTGIEMTETMLEALESGMKERPFGFSVSKISDSFFEHRDIIALFNEDDVCSFVAVPFFNNNNITSILVTYVKMKDNWHSSIDRYMLNDDDLNIYQLLFRELGYSIKRMEAADKVRKMNSQLKSAATTDMLTGILNRAGMYKRLEEISQEVFTENNMMDAGLMFVDLDNFKFYNDSFGHDVGDIILKEVAKILKELVKGYGIAVRYGGDEFIVLVTRSDKEFLEHFAKRIYIRFDEEEGFRQAIRENTGNDIVLDKKQRITCSIGIAYAKDVSKMEQIDHLIKMADDRLYSVKKANKGTYAFYED